MSYKLNHLVYNLFILVSFISLSVMHLRFIHVVVFISPSSLSPFVYLSFSFLPPSLPSTTIWFTAKLSWKCRLYVDLLPSYIHSLLTSNSGLLFLISEPMPTCHFHAKSVIYIRMNPSLFLLLYILSVSFDKNIMAWIYHYSIIYSYFSALKICALPLHPFHSLL